MFDPKRYHTIEEIPKMEIELSDYMAEMRFEQETKELERQIEALQKKLKAMKERQDLF